LYFEWYRLPYQAVQLVKERKTFVFVIDNIDWSLKVHDMQSDGQNTSVHAVATSIVFDCVKPDDLSDEIPNVNLKNDDSKDLIKLSAEEMRCIRLEMQKVWRCSLCSGTA
jgi:hypothetical protein